MNREQRRKAGWERTATGLLVPSAVKGGTFAKPAKRPVLSHAEARAAFAQYLRQHGDAHQREHATEIAGRTAARAVIRETFEK